MSMAWSFVYRSQENSFGEPITADVLTELDAKGWELYHVEKDWAENDNVAAENRSKLIEMIATWYAEAGKYHVLPIDSRGILRFADERPEIAADRTSYVYYPETQPIPANAAVRVLNRRTVSQPMSRSLQEVQKGSYSPRVILRLVIYSM